MLSVGETLKETQEFWEDDKDNWMVFSYTDQDGYLVRIISYKNRRHWVIKSFSLSPFEAIGLGLCVEDIDVKLAREAWSNGEPYNFFMSAPAESEVVAATGVDMHQARKPAAVIPKRIDSELTEELEKIIMRRRPDYFGMYG